MSSVTEPIDAVIKLIHKVYGQFKMNKDFGHHSEYNDVQFHLHTETLALSPSRFSKTHVELGPRFVFDGKNTAVLDGQIPVHVVLNAEATIVLECFRSSNVLILTSSSSFGRLGAFMSNKNRVVMSKTMLDNSIEFVKKEVNENEGLMEHALVGDKSKHFDVFSMSALNQRSVGIMAWSIASLGEKEIERFHGYDTTLDDSETVSFILKSDKIALSANEVGSCPIELKGGIERKPNHQRIKTIHGYKSLIDRQGPMSDPVGLFGNACSLASVFDEADNL